MSIRTHIDAIAEKRSQLKEQIAVESSRPAPDFTLITNLKKQNLTLKEEMQRYLILMKKESMSA